MLDPLGSLFHSRHVVEAALPTNIADPAAAQGLMIVGWIIIFATALWSVGALAAAVSTKLSDLREERRPGHQRTGEPSRR